MKPSAAAAAAGAGASSSPPPSHPTAAAAATAGLGGGGGASGSSSAPLPNGGIGQAPLSARTPKTPRLELPCAMLATKLLVLRTGFELSTPKLAEVVAGSTVELHEMRQLPDGAMRGLVAIHNGPRGWVTMIHKDGTNSLVEAAGRFGDRSARESARSAHDCGGRDPLALPLMSRTSAIHDRSAHDSGGETPTAGGARLSARGRARPAKPDAVGGADRR